MEFCDSDVVGLTYGEAPVVLPGLFRIVFG